MSLHTANSCRSINYIKHFERKEKKYYVWDKIIFSNTIKDPTTLSKDKTVQTAGDI